MFRHLGNNALDKITDIFECCRESGAWVWDTADVIFLKKDGKRDFSDAGSYRPISNIYIFIFLSKLFFKGQIHLCQDDSD